MARHRHSRRRNGNPSPFDQLSKILNLKKESRHRKACASRLVVTPLNHNTFSVSGGECGHVVALKDQALFCTDHAPTHPMAAEGFACAHEIAVRRFLTEQLTEAEVAA